MSRKNQTITVSLSEEEKAILEEIALRLGQTWGNNPNISKLLRSIASGRLRVVDDQSPPEKQLSDSALARQSIAVMQGELSKLLRLI